MIFSDGLTDAEKAEAKADAIRMIEEKVYQYALLCGFDPADIADDWDPGEDASENETSLKSLLDRLAWANTL